MCANHQACRSSGGRMNFITSSPASTMPSTPKASGATNRAIVPAAMCNQRSVVIVESMVDLLGSWRVSAPPRAAALCLEPGQRAQRFVAPVERGTTAVLAVVQRQQREGQLRVICHLLAQPALDVLVGCQHLALAGPDV